MSRSPKGLRRWLWLLLSEIDALIQQLIFSMRGRIGTFLRSKYLVTISGSGNKRIHVSPGCHFFGARNMVFGHEVKIGVNCVFSAETGKTRIGNHVAFNSNVCVGSDFGEIEIGDNVLVAMNCVIRAADHGFDLTPDVLIREQKHRGGKIVIGNDVWIGANVCLLAGTKIGDHCVIGAGSIVVGEIPPRSLAVGAPARVIRKL